jgi:hypothetical protein
MKKAKQIRVLTFSLIFTFLFSHIILSKYQQPTESACPGTGLLIFVIGQSHGFAENHQFLSNFF